MQSERKKLEELNLLDDFLFNAMMTYPEMGEKFTRKILKLLFNKAVLYTKGTKGDDISEELRQFLNYMENTTQTNAVNDTLKDIQKMVDIVKWDGEVSLSYMKGFERDTIMYEKGQEAERQNTERERQRADSAEKARDEAKKERDEAKNARDESENARTIAEKEKIKAQKETAEALKRVAELEKILQCKTAEVK